MGVLKNYVCNLLSGRIYWDTRIISDGNGTFSQSLI